VALDTPRQTHIAACVIAAGVALFCASAPGWSAAYTDPLLLDVPWRNYSFIRQGWRGYLEIVPEARYRDGLGVVWGQLFLTDTPRLIEIGESRRPRSGGET
jgi:hypothetical protein